MSGGQTGVDRAALDFAIQHGIPHRGWCPRGRLAEDGVLDTKYVLEELASGSYRQRTKRNVIDSDGTLILNSGDLDGGTFATLNFAQQFHKPFHIVQFDDDIGGAIISVLEWVRANNVKTLNAAGPRESKRPGVYILTLDFMNRLNAEFSTCIDAEVGQDPP